LLKSNNTQSKARYLIPVLKVEPQVFLQRFSTRPNIYQTNPKLVMTPLQWDL
jgi:hypothetical protein